MRNLVAIADLKRARNKIVLLAALPFASAVLPLTATQAAPVQKSAQGLTTKANGAVESPKSVATSGNPLFPGWYADPEVAVFGQQYWIYPTYSAPYDEQTFLDAFSSPDLVTWTKHPRVLDASNVTWARRAMWAPALVAKGGKYFLFFGANDIQNDKEIGGIGVAVADSPAGPFKDYLASLCWARSTTVRSQSTSSSFRIKTDNIT